jgi:hypothetical protein
LHEEGVGVVDDDDFDGGEEVVVSLFGTATWWLVWGSLVVAMMVHGW